jgi:hypothetical protein
MRRERRGETLGLWAVASGGDGGFRRASQFKLRESGSGCTGGKGGRGGFGFGTFLPRDPWIFRINILQQFCTISSYVTFSKETV